MLSILAGTEQESLPVGNFPCVGGVIWKTTVDERDQIIRRVSVAHPPGAGSDSRPDPAPRPLTGHYSFLPFDYLVSMGGQR